MIISTTPKKDGFYMPAEYAEHEGCIMVWPERPGSWIYGAKAAREAFKNVALAIAKSENVYIAAGSDEAWASANEAFKGTAVKVIRIESDDAWARDIGPTFVVNKERKVRAVNWQFNAWGGEYDGLYVSWDKDDAFAVAFAEMFGYSVYDAAPFVLEGGSIHSDGEGTILVTESCLLSKGRNPKLNKEEIEAKLCEYLGAEKVVWLPCGIYMDETNEHVDNMCAFVGPAEVVLAWTDDETDPQYEMSQASYKALEEARDAKGRKFTIHKLHIPKIPVCITEYELAGYVFEKDEDDREVGERLAASYVNFYFSNGAVVLPQFGGDNVESDRLAVEEMSKLCPDREIIPIAARDILVGGGNIHCITQQIPKGEKA